MRVHQAALQAVADVNNDTRAASTPGYDGSVQYVMDRLSEAGYSVELDEFEITYVPPALLVQLTPIAQEYETGAFTGSGSGMVSGNVIAVDLALVTPQASTSGCTADDFTHLACDTFDNISIEAFDVNVDAVAASTLQYAMNTMSINGVRGKGNFKSEGPRPSM